MHPLHDDLTIANRFDHDGEMSCAPPISAGHEWACAGLP